MARLASNGIHERPEIRVYSVGSQLYLMPTWEEFQRVIKDALVGISEKDVNKLIQRLRGIVISRTKLNSEARRFVNTLRRIVKRSSDTFVLRMHGEAVIAALREFRYRQSTVSSTNPEFQILSELSKVLGFLPV